MRNHENSHRTVPLTAVALLVLAAIGGATSALASGDPGSQTPTAVHDPSLGAAAVLEPSFIDLETTPAKVTIHSVTYRMQVDVSQELGAFAGPPTIDVELSRGTLKSSSQGYDYEYAPESGIAFTYDVSSLGTVKVAASNAIAPSAMAMAYTAGRTQSTSCTLPGGSKGAYTTSHGNIAATTFKFASGTSPFFGTITTKPVKATLFYDPGCKLPGSGGVARCNGTEMISAGPVTLTTQWSFYNDYDDSHAYQMLDKIGPGSVLASYAMQSRVSDTDLPTPVATATGATAQVKATGNQFMTGAAAFTSTTAPKVSKARTCADTNGTKHTYTDSTYTGKLKPATSGLSANFDLAALPLTTQPATLDILHYTS